MFSNTLYMWTDNSWEKFKGEAGDFLVDSTTEVTIGDEGHIVILHQLSNMRKDERE